MDVALLDEGHIVEADEAVDLARRQEMLDRAKRTSVPQIFIGDTHVGGYDDLVALDRAGGLAPLLEAKA